jgi:hypothetical protein
MMQLGSYEEAQARLPSTPGFIPPIPLSRFSKFRMELCMSAALAGGRSLLGGLKGIKLKVRRVD